MSGHLGQIPSNEGVWQDELGIGEYTNGTAGSNTTAVVAEGVMRLYPFMIYKDMTIDYIACEIVTTPGGAGSVTRLGIYDNVDGIPTNLVLDAGTVATTGTGMASIAISQALTAGIYWMTAVSQGASTPAPTYRVITINTGQKRSSTATANMTRWSFQENGVTGALPSTTSATIGIGQAPIVVIKRSA